VRGEGLKEKEGVLWEVRECPRGKYRSFKIPGRREGAVLGNLKLNELNPIGGGGLGVGL